MKNTHRALAVLCAAGFAGLASAGTISITPANATAPVTGGATTPTPHSLTYAPAGGDITNNLQGRLLYNTTLLDATVTDVGGNCANNDALGRIIFLSANNTANALGAVTLCTIAFTSANGAPAGNTTLDVQFDAGQGDGCIDFPGNPTACTLEDGTINITAGTFAYTFAPPTLNFNGTVGNPTATQNVTVSATAGNTGNLNITGCTFNGANGADFSFNPAPTFPISIAAGNNATLPVRFTAGALGARTGTLDCVTNGTSPGPNFSVTLNGTGATNTLTNTPSLTFGNTNVGVTAAAQNVVASAGAGNTGNVTITSCVVGGANAGDFAQTPAVTNVNVAPGASTNIPVTFTPTAGGARAATLTCNLTNGPAATFVTTLSGTGVPVAPIFAANPVTGTAVGGTGFAGTPLSRSVNFANSGNGAGTVTCTLTGASPGLTLAGSPLNVAAGANGNITVTGSTNTPSTLTGTLDCTDSIGGAYSYPLSFVFGAPLIAQIPAVDGLGRFALLGLFAGLGMFFAFRKRG